MNRFDNMSKDAMARVEEIMNSTKLNEFLHRKEEEEKLQPSHTVYTVSLLRITWRISKMISMTILTMTSSRMRMTRNNQQDA